MFSPKNYVLVVILLFAGFATGCGKSPVLAPTATHDSGVWDSVIFRDRNDLPPITTSHGWIDDQVVFLIVPTFKRAGGGGGSGSGGLPPETRIHGRIYLPDGTSEVAFEAKSIAGNAGKVEHVVIASREYDLNEGRVFFLSLSDKGFDVTQVNKDTRDLTPKPKDGTEIEAFLRSMPQFETFFPNAVH